MQLLHDTLLYALVNHISVQNLRKYCIAILIAFNCSQKCCCRYFREVLKHSIEEIFCSLSTVQKKEIRSLTISFSASSTGSCSQLLYQCFSIVLDLFYWIIVSQTFPNGFLLYRQSCLCYFFVVLIGIFTIIFIWLLSIPICNSKRFPQIILHELYNAIAF